MTRLRISKNDMIFSPSLFESDYLAGGGRFFTVLLMILV